MSGVHAVTCVMGCTAKRGLWRGLCTYDDPDCCVTMCECGKLEGRGKARIISRVEVVLGGTGGGTSATTGGLCVVQSAMYTTGSGVRGDSELPEDEDLGLEGAKSGHVALSSP